MYATPTLATAGRDGRYRADGLSDRLIYSAYAWHAVRYLDQDWCVRLAPSPSTGSEPFGGAQGAIRDFTWRLSGPVEGAGVPETEDGHWWGGTVRIFVSYADGDYDRSVELTFDPDGPLIDGSAGATVLRRVEPVTGLFALDIPAGRYRVTAVDVSVDGTRVPLLVGQTGSEPVGRGNLRVRARVYRARLRLRQFADRHRSRLPGRRSAAGALVGDVRDIECSSMQL